MKTQLWVVFGLDDLQDHVEYAFEDISEVTGDTSYLGDTRLKRQFLNYVNGIYNNEAEQLYKKYFHVFIVFKELMDNIKFYHSDNNHSKKPKTKNKYIKQSI